MLLDEPAVSERYEQHVIGFAEQLAATLRRQGWAEPALLALDVGRPLALVVAQALWIARPAAGLLGSGEAVDQLARLLESPAALDRLMADLEGPSSPS